MVVVRLPLTGCTSGPRTGGGRGGPGLTRGGCGRREWGGVGGGGGLREAGVGGGWDGMGMCPAPVLTWPEAPGSETCG